MIKQFVFNFFFFLFIISALATFTSFPIIFVFYLRIMGNLAIQVGEELQNF